MKICIITLNTNVIKSGLRNGDKAPSAQIEFVDRLEEVEIDEVVEEVTS